VDTAPPGFPRRQKSQGGFRTRAEALDAMNRFQVEMQDGTYVQPTRLTTGQYLRTWLAEVRARGLVRPTTIKTYDVAVRVHIAPRLGAVPVQQLTRRRIKDLYNILRQNGRSRGRPGGLSPKSVHNIHLTLHRALEDAIDDGLLRSNPATRAHRIGTVRKEMRWWTPDELHAFLAAVESEPSFALWRLAASTGMRRGELLGLQWSDVDLGRGLLSVQRQLVRNGEALGFGPPKTWAGRRSIYVDRATLEVMRTHQLRQIRDKLAGAPAYRQHPNLVFCHSDGRPRDPDVVSHQFARLVLRTGLRRIRLHDLCHTHASIALQAGVHPKVLQERLGHSNVKVTLDTYAHVMPPMHADAAARIAAIVDGR
jgi:integrase